MSDFDSLSFALLIPFAICFILIFIVCCYADEIKDICRMPSPLPSNYLIHEHRRSRTSSRHRVVPNDEARNLILNEEGRSRNVSESSADQYIARNLLADSFGDVRSTRLLPVVEDSQSVRVLLQRPSLATMVTASNIGIQNTEDASKSVGKAQSNQVFTVRSETEHHHFGPFTRSKTSKSCENYVRNLTMHLDNSNLKINPAEAGSSKCESVRREERVRRNNSLPEALHDTLHVVIPHSSSSDALKEVPTSYYS